MEPPFDASGTRRKCRTLSLAALAAGFLLAAIGIGGSAAAQGHSRADEEACTPDVYRLCNDYVPNRNRIVSCLKAKRSQLSPKCRAVMSGSRSKRSSR